MVYPVGAPPRTRTVHPVRVYILKVYLSFFSSLPRVRIGDRWTKIDNETKPSLEGGRSPKRIGPNTRPNLGPANIAGFDPPTLCAWSNTGADRELTKHSSVSQRRLIKVVFRLHKPAEPSAVAALPGRRLRLR